MPMVDKNGQPLPVIRIEKQKSWKRLWFILLGVPGLFLLFVPWISGITPGGQIGEPVQGPFDSGAAFAVTVVLAVLGLGMAGPAIFFGLRREGYDFTTDGTKMAGWWGVGVPLRFRSLDRTRYSELMVARETKRGGNGRHEWFEVAFGGAGGRSWLASFNTYRPARQAAERIAKQLQFPMRDRGGHDEIVRAYEDLDVPLRGQPDRFGHVPTTLPTLPPGSKFQFAEMPEGARLRLPAAGIRGPRLTRALLGSAASFLIWAFLLSAWSPFAEWVAGTNVADAVAGVWGQRVLWALVAIPIIVLVVPAIWRGRTTDRLEIRPDALRVHRYGPIGRRGIEMPANEIEEITVAPAEMDWGRDPKQREYVVSVRSDAGFVELGAGLTDLERQWLRDTLLFYLAG